MSKENLDPAVEDITQPEQVPLSEADHNQSSLEEPRDLSLDDKYLSEMAAPAGFRSGFVSLTGRPNVGKSTLLNQILDEHVSIVSNKAQTTRSDIKGVYTSDTHQIVFVDTPGISKPVSELGKSLNRSALGASDDVDLVCFIVDGNSGFGKGDRFVAAKLDPANTVCVLNKIDGVKPEKILAQLSELAELNFSSYYAVSAWTGKGVDDLVEYLKSRMAEGPLWFPKEARTDRGDGFRVAELVREQLLRVAEKELPHSIATRLVSWEWPRIKVEILVERESQKPIVIGKNGSVLKQVGINVRKKLDKGAYLELVVKVRKNWQEDADAISEFGY